MDKETKPVKSFGTKGTYGKFFAQAKSVGYYPKFVVDVGVAKGTDGLYTSFPRSRFLMVEPLEEFEPYMKKLSEEYDATYVLAAAGSEDGEIPIRIVGGLSGSSVLPAMNEDYASTDNRFRTVKMIRLDSLIDEFRIAAPLVLKIDIQGAELLALDGGERMLEMADIVILETSLFKFYGDPMPELYDVVDYMKNRGYVVYEILGGSYRELDGALGQVDLVFVQKNGVFRQSHLWG